MDESLFVAYRSFAVLEHAQPGISAEDVSLEPLGAEGDLV